ncbi:MAG: PstS family phosphate ABC transporter substrate-binding protein [Phycisphaerae bacterium]
MARKLQMAAVATVVLAVLFGACGEVLAQSAGDEEQIQIEGSTTVGPIAKAFAEAFMSEHENVNVTVKLTGSGDGAAALIDGRCHVAAMSRFMKPGEFAKAVENGVLPVAHTVAMDGVCPVVHPSNPVGELTTQELKDIYLGNITNWKQLGGVDQRIVAISRDTSSGTFGVFSKLVMNDEKMTGGVEYVTSNQNMHQRIASTRGAIGYVGVGFLDRNVKAVKLDGVAPDRRTLATGQFPLVRPLFMWTDGYPKIGSTLHQFVSFYLTETGQDIIEAKGFVPLTKY